MQELIDRQAALKKMCDTCGYCEKCENAMRSTHPDFVAGNCNNYRFFAELPIIEAEPVRHGRWINNTFCSECKRFPVPVDVSVCNQELTKYFSRCPHCGAVMDLRTPTEVQLYMADSVMMGEVAE